MDRGREVEASEKDEKRLERSDGTVAAPIRNDSSAEKIESTPVRLDKETISNIRAICEELKADSLVEKVRWEVKDVSDQNLKLLKQLSLESVKWKSDNLDGPNPTPLPLPKNDISMARPKDAFERMDSSQHVPLKDLLHYFRCDHVHPTECVEDLYNSFYNEFKYHRDRKTVDRKTVDRKTVDQKTVDPSYEPRIDSVTRAKEWCYMIDSKLQWTSYVISPLNAMMFFESYCDFITSSYRIHGHEHKPTIGHKDKPTIGHKDKPTIGHKHKPTIGHKHKPTIGQLKRSLIANKDIINKCAYLTPINDSTFKKRNLIECFNRLMVAIEECRLEFNSRQKKYLKGDENRQLEPTLPIFEKKLLLAIREHDCHKLEEKLAAHDPKVLDEMRKKVELLKEASELREFITKKEESIQIDVEKRVKEAEAKESSQKNSVSEKLEQMRGLKVKLSSDLELINAAKMLPSDLELINAAKMKSKNDSKSLSCTSFTSSGSKDPPFSPGGETLPVSEIKSEKPVFERPTRCLRSSTSSSQTPSSQPSSKTTKSSSGKAKEATRRRFLISDPDFKHPETTFDYLLAVKECRKELKRIRKEVEAKDEAKMKVEEEIENSKRLKEEIENSKRLREEIENSKRLKEEIENSKRLKLEKCKKPDEQLSGVKREENEAINLGAEEMGLQKAIDESLRVSRRGSSRPSTRQSSNSADSDFCITID